MTAAPSARDPWLAAGLSILLPGLGQFYASRPLRGAGWMLFAALSYVAFFLWIFSETRTGPLEGGALLLATVVADSGSWIDAWFAARGRGSPRHGSRPALAAALSLLLPGLGQLYALVRLKTLAGASGFLLLGALGLVSLGASLEGPLVPGWPVWLMRWPAWLSVVAGAGLSAGASIHAYFLASTRLHEGPRLPRLPRVFVAAAIVALVAAELPWLVLDGVGTFRIPSSSMEPTLMVRDRVFARRTKQVGRGDIIVFRPPHDPGVDYIKRVVALPGERITVRGHEVFVDGRKLEEPFARWGGENAPSDFGPFVVPPEAFFVMGDNRDFSLDSRFFGPVPRGNIFGRAIKRYFPLSRAGALTAPVSRETPRAPRRLPRSSWSARSGSSTFLPGRV